MLTRQQQADRQLLLSTIKAASRAGSEEWDTLVLPERFSSQAELVMPAEILVELGKNVCVASYLASRGVSYREGRAVVPDRYYILLLLSAILPRHHKGQCYVKCKGGG